MILAVDAGNSNIVLGCMDGLTVQHTVRLETDRTMDAAGYTAAVRAALEGCGYPGSRFAGAILSSVVAAVTEPLRRWDRAPTIVCAAASFWALPPWWTVCWSACRRQWAHR